MKHTNPYPKSRWAFRLDSHAIAFFLQESFNWTELSVSVILLHSCPTAFKLLLTKSDKRAETEQKRNVSEQNRTETEQKPNRKDVKLTEKREAILQLMSDNPYISKAEISKLLGLHPSAVSRNIEAMRGKYLRRVGPDKGGFWEIIK